jgi:hypothetical protein
MPEIPDSLMRYFAARDAQRDNQVTRALEGLSDRERALVREAAVMGYVLGAQDAAPSPDIPKDSAVVWRVIDACRAHADLYPTLAALPERTTDA